MACVSGATRASVGGRTGELGDTAADPDREPVPGSLASGTDHFAHCGRPADDAVAPDYDVLYPNLMEQIGRRLAELAPADADAGDVAAAIVDVEMPHGRRPFRVHIDPRTTARQWSTRWPTASTPRSSHGRPPARIVHEARSDRVASGVMELVVV
jgi:hypothetical protein